jgi:hypothetical protein
MSEANIIEGAPITMGTFWDKPIKFLFDSGATNSFLNGKTREKLGLEAYSINKTYKITTPGGEVVSNRITKKLPLVMGSKMIHSNLIILDLEGIDIILGMDWMNRHKIILDIPERMVEINSPIVGSRTLYLPFKDVVNPCSYVAITSHLEEIPVVREFADVFPNELPIMPPDRDVEFVIELQPDTAPISKRPYRILPKELAYLKTQLQELLDKGYIRSSFSPWGCPTLFVKKKDGSLRLCVDY